MMRKKHRVVKGNLEAWGEEVIFQLARSRAMAHGGRSLGSS